MNVGEGYNKLNPFMGFWGFCWRWVCKALSCPLYVVHKIKGTKYTSDMCDDLKNLNKIEQVNGYE